VHVCVCVKEDSRGRPSCFEVEAHAVHPGRGVKLARKCFDVFAARRIAWSWFGIVVLDGGREFSTTQGGYVGREPALLLQEGCFCSFAFGNKALMKNACHVANGALGSLCAWPTHLHLISRVKTLESPEGIRRQLF
jgi:hypothetical protein